MGLTVKYLSALSSCIVHPLSMQLNGGLSIAPTKPYIGTTFNLHCRAYDARLKYIDSYRHFWKFASAPPPLK